MWQISKPPWEWCEFGQVFNGQLGQLYQLGDWKKAESWPMLKFCLVRIILNFIQMGVTFILAQNKCQFKLEGKGV